MRRNNFEKDFEEFVVVKESPIHGKGIFADAEIPAGELVMVIRGEVITGTECERREEEDNNVYIFWNGRYYIDTVNTEKIKYINHEIQGFKNINKKMGEISLFSTGKTVAS